MNDYVTKQDLKQEFDDFSIKLFRYLNENFDKINARMDTYDEKLSGIYSAIDAYAKQVETYAIESKVRDHQVDRIQGWVEQLAAQAGLKLEY